MTLWRLLSIGLVALGFALVLEALDMSARDLAFMVLGIVLIMLGAAVWSRPGGEILRR
jgi:hypothetical protein